MELTQLLFPPTPPLQDFALIFLLGSLSVSSLSDLKRMAAQTDFAQVWIAFTILMFSQDLYLGLTSQLPFTAFLTKWILLVLTVTAASSPTISQISSMDVAAQTALYSTLTPAYILLAIILTILFNEILKPILRSYGDAGAYPYLPTVFTVNLLILAITQLGGIEPYLTTT